MENKNTNDYIFLARDNIKKVKNEKHYTSILISDLEKVKSIFDLNNHLYEILPSFLIDFILYKNILIIFIKNYISYHTFW